MLDVCQQVLPSLHGAYSLVSLLVFLFCGSIFFVVSKYFCLNILVVDGRNC